MIPKTVLALGLSLLLPLANLQAQTIVPYASADCMNLHTETSPMGIAYETGIGTSRLAATIIIGTIGVAIVAIALYNTNYCAGHHHNNCHSNKNSQKHTHNCH